MAEKRKLSYEDLEIWQLGMDIAAATHDLTSAFPREEMYGLTSQMRRAAVSVPSNIAEGYMRQSRRVLAQFLAIAKGSLAELETQTALALRFRYIDKTKHDDLREMTDHLSRKITLFRQRMRDPQR